MYVGLSWSYLGWMAAAWIAVVVWLAIFVRFRAWRARGWFRRSAARLLLALWAIAFALVLSETLFVSCYSTTDAFSLSLISQRWNERFVERNNWNCRDTKRYTGAPAPGMRRLAILGDSFAFGHGIKRIEDRFGDIIGARLKKESSDPWETYNLAEPGASIGWQIDKRLPELASNGFAAECVLLAYCLNDIEDLNPKTYEIVGSIINDPPKSFFCQKFFLPNFLFYRLNHFRRPEVNGYFDWLADSYKGETWDKQKARLERIESWCKERNAKLMVVIFPFMNAFQNDYAFEYAHETLDKYFAERGISCLDLLPIYRKHASERLVVNPFDAHPNERAHRIAADAIWDELVKPAIQK